VEQGRSHTELFWVSPVVDLGAGSGRFEAGDVHQFRTMNSDHHDHDHSRPQPRADAIGGRSGLERPFQSPEPWRRSLRDQDRAPRPFFRLKGSFATAWQGPVPCRIQAVGAIGWSVGNEAHLRPGSGRTACDELSLAVLELVSLGLQLDPSCPGNCLAC